MCKIILVIMIFGSRSVVLLVVLQGCVSITVKLLGSKYVKRHDTFLLNCTTDTKPIGLSAELLVRKTTFATIRRFRDDCYSETKCEDICDCSKDGTWYSHTYKITGEENATQFTCIIKFGRLGSFSSTIDVTILDIQGPDLSVESGFPLIVGTTAKLICNVWSTLNHISIQWKCREHNYSIIEMFANRLVSILPFKVQQIDHGHVCKCIAKVFDFEASSAVQLNVTSLPLIYSSMTHTCKSEESVTMHCGIQNGHTEYEFDYWIHSFNGVFVRKLKGHTRRNISCIRIDSCTYQDTGIYKCISKRIYSGKEIRTSNSTTLTVYSAPIIQTSKVLKDHQNSSYTLSVTFYSASKVFIPSWFKENALITNSTRYLQSFKSEIISMKIHDITLNITGYMTDLTISSHLAGNYSVQLENEYGKTTKYVQVQRVSGLSSFDLSVIVSITTTTGIFLLAVTVMTICIKLRFFENRVVIVGPTDHSPVIPIYHSAPQDQENVHKYEDTVHQYVDVIDSVTRVQQGSSSDTNIEAVLNQGETSDLNTDMDYEEID